MIVSLKPGRRRWVFDDIHACILLDPNRQVEEFGITLLHKVWDGPSYINWDCRSGTWYNYRVESWHCLTRTTGGVFDLRLDAGGQLKRRWERSQCLTRSDRIHEHVAEVLAEFGLWPDAEPGLNTH